MFLDQFAGFGGGQTVLLQLIRTALKSDLQVTLMAPGGGRLQEKVSAEFRDRVRFLPIAEPKLAQGKKSFWDLVQLAMDSLQTYFQMRDEFTQTDFIYVNGPRWAPLAYLASFFHPSARFFYHVHLDYSRAEKSLFRKIVRRPNTAALVVVSKFVRDRLQEFSEEFNSPNVRLIRNALTPLQSQAPFMDRFKAETPFRVAMIGRISPEKGHGILLELAKRNSAVEFFILGDAEFSAQEFYRDLQARAPFNVKFLGHISDLSQSLEEHKIQFSLVPSTWEEPFGLVAIESMAHSLLTISSSQGGLKEIAEATGMVIFQNPEDLNGIFKGLLSKPRADLAQMARIQHSQTVAHFGSFEFENQISTLFSQIFGMR